jgi:hypothetical protein
MVAPEQSAYLRDYYNKHTKIGSTAGRSNVKP